MKQSGFVALDFFKCQDFSLVGIDEQPVPLNTLPFIEETTMRKRITALRLQNIKQIGLEFVKGLIGIVELDGLAVIISLLTVFLFPLGQMGMFFLAFSAIFVFINRAAKDFVINKKTKDYINKSAKKRKLNTEKIKILKKELGLLKSWDNIPVAVRDEIRQLLALISKYNTNIKLYNAETKEINLRIERGHLADSLLTETETEMKTKREILDSQKCEIVKTIKSADAACITFAFPSLGEQALISNDLDDLRLRLNELNAGMQELDKPKDFDRRLLAAKNKQTAG